MLNDFVEYWSAAKLLVEGRNPYSPHELAQQQYALGWNHAEPLMMWNPPWTLSFIFPLGYMDYNTAQFIWFLVHALILFVGSRILWDLYGGNLNRQRHYFFALLTFAPVYFVLLIGQIGPLILLGLIGFLYFSTNGSWRLAGASLCLAAIKPHLTYLLWLALILWGIRTWCWRLVAGAGITAVLIAIAPLFWSVSIYTDYIEALQSSAVIRPHDWATPTLGAIAGEMLATSSVWVRWFPCILGVGWLVYYWRRRSDAWTWSDETPVVLLASIVTASFAWTFDHVILLPAVLQSAVWLSEGCVAKPLRRGVVLTFVLLGGAILVGKIFVRNDLWYFWTAPVYLILYWTVRSASRLETHSATSKD